MVAGRQQAAGSLRRSEATGAPRLHSPPRALRLVWLLALCALSYVLFVSSVFGPGFHLQPGAAQITAWQTITQDGAGLLAVLAALPAAWLLSGRPLPVHLAAFLQFGGGARPLSRREREGPAGAVSARGRVRG
ncbi:MAG: hypothetical protein ACLFV8_09570, partial [Alphaproteobacteria bacterium]